MSAAAECSPPCLHAALEPASLSGQPAAPVRAASGDANARGSTPFVHEGETDIQRDRW